jgi:acyl-homoserine lactone acylase PvdQ
MLNVAKNWDEFVRAVQKMDIGSFNVLYADIEGNIGYYLSGHIPIRKNVSVSLFLVKAFVLDTSPETNIMYG